MFNVRSDQTLNRPENVGSEHHYRSIPTLFYIPDFYISTEVSRWVSAQMLCGVKCRVSLCVQLSENTCSSTAAAVNISRDGRDGVLQPDHRRAHHPGRTAGLRSLSEFLLNINCVKSCTKVSPTQSSESWRQSW